MSTIYRGILLLILIVSLLSHHLTGVKSMENQRKRPIVGSADLLVPDDELDDLSMPDSYQDDEALTYINKHNCRAIGECEVCTELEKKSQLYCAETGNKEPIECVWDGPVHDNAPSDAILPVFRSCPRVKRVERMRFFEFQTVNILLGLTAGSVLVWRQRKLAREAVNRLARRIGTMV